MMKIALFSRRSYELVTTQLFATLFCGIVCHADIQNGKPEPTPPVPAAEDFDVNHIVSELTSGEAEFHAAFKRYGYKRDLVVQTLKNGKVTGEYRRTTQVVLGKDGELKEKLISFPKPSLTEIRVTQEDLEDLSYPLFLLPI